MSSSSIADIPLGATEILSSIDSLCDLSRSLASFKTGYDFQSIYVDMRKCLTKLGGDLKFFGESHFDTLKELLPCVDHLRLYFEGAFGQEKQMVKKALSALRSGGSTKASKNEKAFHMIYDKTIGKRLSPMSLFDIDIIRNNLSLTSALLDRTIAILVGRRDAHEALLREEEILYRERQQERHTNDMVTFFQSSRTTASPPPISISGILTDSPVIESQRQGSADSALMRSLQRLRTPDYAARHKYQQSVRAKETCLWLLEHNKYIHWLHDGPPSILTLSGPPGIGKSVLISQVCDHLFQKHNSESGFCFAYFYMGYDKVQSACDVAASLVKQLCDQSRVVPRLLRTFLNNAESLSMPPLSTLIQVLASYAKTFNNDDCRACIVLDGWDEPNLSEDPGFSTLLEEICKFEWRVLITYRSHAQNRPPVLDSIQTIHQSSITIRPSDTQKDLSSYVKHRIFYSPVRRLLPVANEEAFNRFLNAKTELIVQKSGGIFARAGILTDSLLEQDTLEDIDNMLETTPDDLSAEYTRLLDAIQLQPEHLKVLANRTLIWLACAQRPIPERGFCQALSVAHPTPSEDDDDDDLLSAKRVPQVQTVISCTKGLVTLDLGTSSILLAYYGLKDAIEDYYSDRDQINSSLHQTFESEKTLFAVTCLRYLNLQGGKESLSENAISFTKRLETAPFSSYASQFWASHVAGCGSASIDFKGSNDMMKEFLDLFSNRQSLEMIVQTASVAASPLSWYDSKTFDEISLKVRAMTDLDIMLASITADKVDVPKEPRRRMTEISPETKHSKATDLLRMVIEYCLTPDVLEHSIFRKVATDPASRKKLISTYFDRRLNPQSINEAVRENRLGAVIAWAERLNENRGLRPDPSARRALYNAIDANNLRMVETLLEYGADARSSNEGRGLALFVAVNKNSHDIVDSLLEHGADVNATDNAGRSVLHIAAAAADGRMIDRLLAHGADINHCDNNGCTPLFDAILKSNNRVIANLIEAGVPLRAKRYNDGTTALDHAKLLHNRRAIHQLEVQMSDTSTIGDMSIHSEVDRKG